MLLFRLTGMTRKQHIMLSMYFTYSRMYACTYTHTHTHTHSLLARCVYMRVGWKMEKMEKMAV